MTSNRRYSENMQIPQKGFTHGGTFHADDVFATAFFKLENPHFEYERGFQVPEDFGGIVYDIGGGEFDHHQAGARVRENGVPYAAFGLIWEKYGSLALGEKDAKTFDEEFVQMIDLTDNTGKRNPISTLIREMNPEWDSLQSSDEAFAEAVEFAITILKAKFKHYASKSVAKGIVNDILTKAIKNYEEDTLGASEEIRDTQAGKVLYIGSYIPWRESLMGSEVEAVIYSSNRGGYNVQTVAYNAENDTRVEFPQDWRGKTREELEEITGITGVTFCHKSGFLCATETLEAAWEVAERMVRKAS